MYRRIEDFLADWQNESEGTIQVLSNLTDASLMQKSYEHGMTLGNLAWHLVTTIGEMIGKADLEFSPTPHEDAEPKSAKEILEAYQFSSQALVNAVKEQWNDDTLNEKKDMYGESWSVATILKVLITHQIHHRGQMTVLMRQAGLKVPGLYGPSREEWMAYSELGN